MHFWKWHHTIGKKKEEEKKEQSRDPRDDIRGAPLDMDRA